MTSKQKVVLIAAQYSSKAREMTVVGDQLVRLASALTEEKAKELFEELQRLGLIDSEGILSAPSSGLDALLGKGGLS
jgi:hypothetical protein